MTRVAVAPDMLRWARERARLERDELAARFKIVSAGGTTRPESAAECVSNDHVVLVDRSRAALERFNPHLPKLISGVLGQRGLFRTSWKKQGTMK